jgi:hypothetical protein
MSVNWNDVEGNCEGYFHRIIKIVLMCVIMEQYSKVVQKYITMIKHHGSYSDP